MTLIAWGWDDQWAERAAQEGIDSSSVARVVGQDRASWSVQTDSGPEQARIPSKTGTGPSPVVGDWVFVEPGPMPRDPWSILAVFPRRTMISRGAAGTGGGKQVLATNVDKVWIVHGLDMPLNSRRLERYLARGVGQRGHSRDHSHEGRYGGGHGGRGRPGSSGRNGRTDPMREFRGPRKRSGSSKLSSSRLHGCPPRAFRSRQVDIGQSPRRRRHRCDR